MPLDFNKTSMITLVQETLEKYPSDSREERLKIYEMLRNQIRTEMVEGVSTEKALEKLESTIARQDVFLGYFDLTLESLEDQEESKGKQTKKEALKLPEIISLKKSVWSKLGRKMGLVESFDSNNPPGPTPGDADGPISDHTYIDIEMSYNGLSTNCRFSFNHDPFCNLTLQLITENNSVLFESVIRADSLAFAFEHLSLALKEEGFQLPIAGLHPDAEWLSKSRKEDRVFLPGKENLFAFEVI